MSSMWLSVRECAEYLGISKETVYRMLKAKTIPCHRMGRLWRFNADEIDKWLTSKKKKR